MAMIPMIRRSQTHGTLEVLVHTEDGIAFDEYGRELPEWLVRKIHKIHKTGHRHATLWIGIEESLTVENERIEGSSIRVATNDRLVSSVSLVSAGGHRSYLCDRHAEEIAAIYSNEIENAETK